MHSSANSFTGISIRMNRTVVLEKGKAQLLSRREELTLMFEDLRKGMSEDTKSSVGDKYETSRSMSQQEMDKLSVQLAEINRQLALFPALESVQPGSIIENGSLVRTDKGWFFIGIPLGTLEIQNERIFYISPTAPLAQQLFTKKAGDQCQFGTTSYMVEQVG